MTIGLMNAIITERSRDARVVELADSLDSGSSAHSGRAGSSPASRTKHCKIPQSLRLRDFYIFRGLTFDFFCCKLYLSVRLTLA